MRRIFRQNRPGKNRDHQKADVIPGYERGFYKCVRKRKKRAGPDIGIAIGGCCAVYRKGEKGHKGVEGTPLESYTGTVVHDHDTTFYKYGTDHQECTQHDIRYLIGIIQNETELEWNKQMLELFRKMLHYHNSLSENESLSLSIVSEFEAEYDRILETAQKEYTDEPPGDYYRKGYNLFIRLRKYKGNELLFLHDKRVPAANNSLCERLARVYKRKQRQAVTLRSQKNLCYICNGLSIVYLLRSNEENVYQKIAEIYDRERPSKSEGKTDATA